MQTSGNGSFCTTRTGMAALIGLAIAVTGNWIACTPGEPDCDRVDCGGSTGKTGGSGGGDNTGGSGGSPPSSIKDPPAECGSNASGKGTAALTSFETKFIAPRCGVSSCHKGSNAPFAPKGLDNPASVRGAI